MGRILSFLVVTLVVYVLLPLCAMGEYKVDDKVVAIRTTDLRLGTETRSKAYEGNVLEVRVVNGKWLWVTSEDSRGWLNTADVIPLSEGIAYFSSRIRENPDGANAYYSRAMVWGGKNEYDTAIADLNEAIRLNPMGRGYFQERGYCWERKKEYDKAIADYSEAIRLDSKYASAYNNRGTVWYEKQEYDEAIANYNEAIRLDPKFASAYNQLAWLQATCPDERYRDGKNAVTAATKACELTSWKDDGVMDTLAAAYAESGDFEQACKWQEKAIQLATNEKDNQEFRSRLELYQSGKPYRKEKPQ